MPNPNTLLAATGAGLALSIDGGNNFTTVLLGAIDDIHVDTAATTTSATPQTVYAAVDSTGIFRTPDSGATWTNLWTVSNGSPLSVANFTPGFISFSQSTQPNNQTIYASVQNTNGLAVNPKWGLFVSTDSGATWTQAAASGNPSNNCTQCGYDQTIGVEPRDATKVFLGFVDDWQSTDSGATFTEIGHGVVHNDHHALVFSPHVPGSGSTPFYDGQDGGIALFNGSTFSSLNGPNPGAGKALATNLLRNMDIGRGSSANNKFTYGGMQDTGTAQFTSSSTPTTWHLNLGGDGAGVAVDPFNPMHAVGMADACLNVTTNGGGGWSGASIPGFVGALGFNFGNTLAFDQVSSAGPTDNTVYASTLVATSAPVASCFGICFGFGNTGTCTGPELFRSTDGGSTYAQFGTPVTYPAQINAIATVKIDPATVWLALNDGTLRVSTNATSGSPSFAAPPTQPSVGGAPATALAIDPSDTKTVVVTFGSPTVQVEMTTDGGLTWTDISAGLPSLPAHAVVIDPSTNPHTIIISNDAGVLQTADSGLTWQVLGIGMPTVDVVSLQLDASVTPEVLRAGTFGRSAFDLGPPTGPLIAVNSTFNFGTLCPGQTPTELLQIFNVGTSDLKISSITPIPVNPDFALSGPGFPVTIPAGEEVDFTISFTPTLLQEGTTQTQTYQINSNSVVNPSDSVTYTAMVGEPMINVTGTGIFGSAVCTGTSPAPEQMLEINNLGTCDLNVKGSPMTMIICPGGFPDFTLVNPNEFPATISPDSGLGVGVNFTPTSTGLKSCNLTIISNDPTGPTVIPLTGTEGSGSISVTGSGDFGNEVCGGKAPPQTLRINNLGPCNLHVNGFPMTQIVCPITVNNPSGLPQFTLVNPLEFPANISADSGLDVGINFTPTQAGVQTCTLEISSDDPTVIGTQI